MINTKVEWKIRQTESGRFSIESPDPKGVNPPEIVASCINEDYARFISAAPAMYEALRLACTNMSPIYGCSGDPNKGMQEVAKKYGGGMSYVYKLMRDALSKAERKA